MTLKITLQGHLAVIGRLQSPDVLMLSSTPNEG